MQEGLEEEPESAQEKGAASARERDERETEMAAVFVPQPEEDQKGEETGPPSEVKGVLYLAEHQSRNSHFHVLCRFRVLR